MDINIERKLATTVNAGQMFFDFQEKEFVEVTKVVGDLEYGAIISYEYPSGRVARATPSWFLKRFGKKDATTRSLIRRS